ncbi:septal ring lytic transglycosylase RlpA family protein [Devosia sp.]|uniref:septal ring lytic transglycosylase RlpA family protein n=1 Tax=Devosia sp. TaxID=1871048 RepID=UPI003415587A
MRQATPVKYAAKRSWVAGRALLVTVLALVALMVVFGRCQASAAECGLASWYGPGFHGKRTASGERFDENAMTAAHKTLPHGTIVEVTDQRTGKSIKVTINDRGPFKRGRIIDLSKAAGAAFGLPTARGVTKVCIKILKPPDRA